MIEAKGHAAELDSSRLLAMYELMITGRLLETRLHTMYRGGRLPGAVYPGVGQEAAQVGFASALEPGDIFGWSALIPPFKATSTVVSLEPVTVIAFDGARLRGDVRSDCDLAAGIYPKLLEALARRLGATRTQLLDLYGSEKTEPW